MNTAELNISPYKIRAANGQVAFFPFTTVRADRSRVYSEKWSSLTVKIEGEELVYYYKSRWGRQHDKTVRQPL